MSGWKTKDEGYCEAQEIAYSESPTDGNLSWAGFDGGDGDTQL